VVETIDEHASFHWQTIYTRTRPKLNPKSKGLIKIILIRPETNNLKLWTQTWNQWVLDFKNMPYTHNQRVLHIEKKIRLRPFGSTKNQELAKTSFNHTWLKCKKKMWLHVVPQGMSHYHFLKPPWLQEWFVNLYYNACLIYLFIILYYHIMDSLMVHKSIQIWTMFLTIFYIKKVTFFKNEHRICLGILHDVIYLYFVGGDV
jgi:hypothetical protein